MKRIFLHLIVAFGTVLPFSFTVKADLFGADAAILSQILQETILQLAELKSILQSGQDTLGFLQNINQGINDSLQMAETMGIRIDPGLYRDLKQVNQTVAAFESIYGRPVNSPAEKVQRNTDETIAEAISFNNELLEYTENLDRVGNQIKGFSHAVSPGGAAKLTAESLGVLIHVTNQQLRASGKVLKLQAQSMAIANKKEKDNTEQYIKEGQALRDRMVSLNPEFQVPRF